MTHFVPKSTQNTYKKRKMRKMRLCANCEKIKHNSSQIAILRKNTIK
ncbi:hypothetical protein HMPREF1586_00545 [Gardnerella vaginalis JCP8522]|nr:hypothetical protein HMPREF1586_00545 [Gardnerella vaginalis JCP8522]